MVLRRVFELSVRVHAMKRAVAPLAIALVALSLMATTRHDGAFADPLPAPGTQASAEEELALKYEPLLKITNQSRACDTGGNVYEPASLEILFGNPEILLRRWPSREIVKEAPTAADLIGLSNEYYLDFPGNPRRPGCGYERDYLRFKEGVPPTIYANVTTERDDDGNVVGTSIAYWFYYYYNDFANKHEGDWEMIQVMFDGVATAEEALQQDPTRTVYSGHGGGELANWTDSKLQKVGDRPVVFVTTGSHASFYSEGIFMGVAKRGQVFGCDPTTGPHRTVDSEVVYLPDDPPTDPEDPNAWMSFQGAWGEMDRNSIFSGPQGPPVRPRWTGPFEYANQQRDFSDKVPDSVLGIDPSGFFCTVVNAGSEFMIFFDEYPWLVGGAVLAVFGTVGMVLVNGVPARLTGRRAPAAGTIVQPGPGFLRRERRLAQLGRGALRIYTMHWRLWAVTGLVLIPVSVGVMFLEQAIGLDWLDDIFNSSLAEPFAQIIGMSFGALIGAMVVSVLVFGSLRRIDEGESPDVGWALRHAWSHRRHIIGEVFLIGAATVGLTLTIVGIPFAVNRTVAWAFAGQAVIIDDRDAFGSMRRSAEVVKGRWWRAAAVLALLGLFIGLPGPVITFTALVLLKPPVLQTIYPVLSMLYVLVLFPLGFIASGLLYGDLSAEAEPSTGP